MPTTRQDVSLAISQLMPGILRGVQLDFFVRRGVTQTQLLVLMAIHADGRCTMSRLARNLQVSLPTMTGVVGRLVRAGYARRTTAPEDRRRVVVELTAKSRQFIADFQQVIRRRWDDVLRALTPDELEAFHAVLIKLIARLNDRSAP